MRRHTDLSHQQLQRIAESKTVPCPPRHTRRGCGAPVGEACVSLATGRPLGGLGAHVDRLLAARTARLAPRPRQPDADTPSGRVLASA